SVTITTGADGKATAPPFVANSTAWLSNGGIQGALYSVTASTTGGLQTSFSLTNLTAGANQIAAGLTGGSAAVGKNLQALMTITLPTNCTQTNGCGVTLTSSDSSKLILSGHQTGAGSGTLVTTVGNGEASIAVYAQALASSGTVTVTVSNAS